MGEWAFEAAQPAQRRQGASVPARWTDAAGRRPLSLPRALGLAAASGLALWSAFPHLNWWPAAPLAVAGLALATRGQRPLRAGLLGLVGGLAFLVPHLHWAGVYVGLLPWTALSVLEAGYLAVMAALMPYAWRVPGGRAATVACVSGLWVAQEAARSRTPFGGFPWARLAFSQADAPTLGYAALGGAPLVTAAVAAVGGCLAVAVVDLRGGRRLGAAVTGGVALALLVIGAAVPRPTASPRSVTLAAVQGNVPRAGLDFNAERRAVLDNHVRLTLQLADDVAAGRAAAPDVVVWPENASDIDPLRNPDAAAVIQSAADAAGVPIVLGAVLAEPAPNISNASIVWGPTSSAAPGPGARYVKRHPAPFAEYVPYRSFFRFFSSEVDLVRADFAPGHTVGVLPAGPARLGDIICFEVAYDDLVHDTVAAGADILVVQTNNATFGSTDESAQQLAMSRLRAVETGRAVVHISTVGLSALIGPDGRQLVRSGHFVPQLLQARLPLRTDPTVATRLGALPELLLGLTGILLAAGAALTARRRGKRSYDVPGQSPGGGQESDQ